jgi:hypothetical protein
LRIALALPISEQLVAVALDDGPDLLGMLVRIEHWQGAIDRVEIVAELSQTEIRGYDFARKLGSFFTKRGYDMRFGHTGKYEPAARIFFGPMLHNTAFCQPCRLADGELQNVVVRRKRQPLDACARDSKLDSRAEKLPRV